MQSRLHADTILTITHLIVAALVAGDEVSYSRLTSLIIRCQVQS